ncbi:sensor histidine kinase [Neorhodopirellula lusitana]|uniref:sensor histidine kinase n=1 Tax=Neorhodopirellula lusitana TaxID=445327 RepID=UPI00384B76EE
MPSSSDKPIPDVGSPPAEPIRGAALPVGDSGMVGYFKFVVLACFLVLPWVGVPGWLVAILAAATLYVVFRVNDYRHEKLHDYFRQQQSNTTDLINQCRADLDEVRAQSRLGDSALLQLIDGVIVLSTDLSILLINPSAVQLLGLTPREKLQGRAFDELVRDPKMVKSIRAAIDERLPQDSIVELHHSDGVRPIRVRVDVIGEEDSLRVQLSLRDETESRQIEGMRREFVANVSHELKTPLAAIKGYAETVELAATDDPEAAIHFMHQIISQCHRLERLISDMMQLARAQSGRSLMKISSIRLREIVTESVRTYEPVAAASGLTLTLHDGGEGSKVMADSEATLTICNNLIGNAIRYTPRGGQIDVSLDWHAGRWAVIVEDTGVGIPESDQSKIFERFYRGSRNTELSTSSTGLGLAIVKNLTLALSGVVSVQSKPGKGSTFRVELPAVGNKRGTVAAVNFGDVPSDATV